MRDDQNGASADAQLDIDARWALLLPLREHMLAVALRRCASEEDAEDCVNEAMLRVAQFDGLNPERAGALLTSVTVRLAVDMHRARARARRHLPRLVSVAAQHQAPDEALLDSDEARWLAAQVERLPQRERDVLLARAAGYSVGESAARLSLSYKAVESAFTRARGRMRAWAGAVLLLAADYLRRLRRRPAAVWTSTALASAGCVVLSSLPQQSAWRSEHRATPPASAAAPVPAQPAGVAAALLAGAGTRWSATATGAVASGAWTTASGSAPAAARTAPTDPQVAEASFGTPAGAFTVHVVGWAPAGKSGPSRALLCVEEGELVHSDGTVGCPKQ